MINEIKDAFGEDNKQPRHSLPPNLNLLHIPQPKGPDIDTTTGTHKTQHPLHVTLRNKNTARGAHIHSLIQMTDLETKPIESKESMDQGQTHDQTEQVATPKVERVFDARQQRINEIRLKFCVRDEFPITKNMIHPDGTLNQEYVS